MVFHNEIEWHNAQLSFALGIYVYPAKNWRIQLQERAPK